MVAKEAQAKKFKPGPRVWFGTVGQLKGGGEFPVQMARYMVENSGTMEDGPVQIFTWHMLICELGAVYL